MRFCSTCPFRARTLRNLASWFSAFSRSSRSFSCSDACCCCCRWSCSFRNRSRCSCGEASGHNSSETHFQTSLSFRTMCQLFSFMVIMDKTVLIWSHDKYDDNCIHCTTLCSRFIQMTLNAQLAHLVCKNDTISWMTWTGDGVLFHTALVTIHLHCMATITLYRVCYLCGQQLLLCVDLLLLP